MEEQQKRHRRTKAELDSMLPLMKASESQGKSRKEIALMFGLTNSQVTKMLGAVRVYRGKRMAA